MGGAIPMKMQNYLSYVCCHTEFPANWSDSFPLPAS